MTVEIFVGPDLPDEQRACEDCGRRRYDTRTRCNLPSKPDLCGDCFEDPDVLARYINPRR